MRSPPAPCAVCLLYTSTFDGSGIDAEFDGYMETLKSMGIEDVIQAYQSAYDRLMSAAG